MDTKSAVPSKRSAALGVRDPFAALRQEMNALFDDFFPGAGGASGPLGAFMPRVDVRETDGEIRVTAEMPGIDEKDVEISVDGDMLTIKGEKKEEKEEKGEESSGSSGRTAASARSVTLPCAVNADKASASYKKGVLTIALPKAAESKKKSIPVKASWTAPPCVAERWMADGRAVEAARSHARAAARPRRRRSGGARRDARRAARGVPAARARRVRLRGSRRCRSRPGRRSRSRTSSR